MALSSIQKYNFVFVEVQHGWWIWIMPPDKRYSHTILWNQWMLPSRAKRNFIDVIKLRTSRWGNYPVLFKWVLNTVRCFLTRGVEGNVTDPGTGNVTTRPGLEARLQQRLEMAKKWFSPEPQERAQPGRLHFSPIKIISDSWPLQLWENTFLLPQVTKFMLICHSNHRKNKYRHNYTWISHMQTHTHTHTHPHTWF